MEYFDKVKIITSGKLRITKINWQ